MAEVDRVVGSFEGVESTATVAGFNMLAGIASTNCGVIFASLKDYSERKLSAMEIASDLTGELYEEIIGGECYAFIPPAIPGLGVTSGITLEVQDVEGRGTAYLAEQSDKLLSALRKEPRIRSATTEFRDGVAQKHLDIDKQHALMSGVSLSSLYSETAALLGGRMINNFNLFGRLYQSYLQAAPEYRESEASLEGYFLKMAVARVFHSLRSLPFATLRACSTSRNSTSIARSA
jgi:HAE1 family hydrophobic/amphiphilic exporter-1